MANRRMFSMDVVDTDRFLDMPLTAQCLYFHLGMRADDDGFIDSPKRILRYIGSNDDDLKILLTKGYLILFEDGVIAIRDWLKNNRVRPDRKKSTRYADKLSLLAVEKDSYVVSLSGDIPDDNQMPTNCQPNAIPDANQVSTRCQPTANQVSTKCQPDANQVSTKCHTQYRLGKDSIGYNIAISNDIAREKQRSQNEKKRKNIPYQKIVDMYNNICVSLPRVTKLSEARKKAIHARYNQYGIDDFKRLFEMAEGSSFLKGGGGCNWIANFDWLIKDENMAKVLDGNYSDRQEQKEIKYTQNKKPYQQFAQRTYTEGEMDELEKEMLQKSGCL